MRNSVKSFLFIFFTSILTLLAVCFLPRIMKPSGSPQRSGLADAQKVRALYKQWETRHEAGGGDQNVVVPLRWTKGLSAEFTDAAGRARLDLIEGSVAVEIRGLSLGGKYDLWLVDNLPGPGRSVIPEPGDVTINIGTLAPKNGVGVCEASIDSQKLRDLELDLVVLSRSGLGPEKGILFGVPPLFQRAYSQARYQRTLAAERVDMPTLSFFDRSLSSLTVHAVSPYFSPDPMIARGEKLFFNEQFSGNGRTCGSCHPPRNNLTIDPAFIKTLPKSDPLFVAEPGSPAFVPALAMNFEKPALMREFGLILENTNGFGDLANNFTMRGVPHTLAMPTSLTPGPDGTTTPPNERTGWSGDGSPIDGSLRAFAVGAVTQHFPRTLNRTPGVDFRLPTDEELDAMEAFQLAVGRQNELALPLPLKSAKVQAGQAIFLNDGTDLTVPAGKCNTCHENAGSNVNFIPGGLNFNFDTGVEDFPHPGKPHPDFPTDDGFGNPGNGTFNTPVLVEAADTGPFFHNNAITTIEGAVGFYSGPEFNASPAGILLGGVTGSGINLTTGQAEQVAAFLRAINALENIRSTVDALDRALAYKLTNAQVERLLRIAGADIDDALEVLRYARLYPAAQLHLAAAKASTRFALGAIRSTVFRNHHIKDAIKQLKSARGTMLD